MRKQDPFFKAQIQVIADKYSNKPNTKKIGILYDEINKDNYEENTMTTFKKQK